MMYMQRISETFRLQRTLTRQQLNGKKAARWSKGESSIPLGQHSGSWPKEAQASLIKATDQCHGRERSYSLKQDPRRKLTFSTLRCARRIRKREGRCPIKAVWKGRPYIEGWNSQLPGRRKGGEFKANILLPSRARKALRREPGRKSSKRR